MISSRLRFERDFQLQPLGFGDLQFFVDQTAKHLSAHALDIFRCRRQVGGGKHELHTLLDIIA